MRPHQADATPSRMRLRGKGTSALRRFAWRSRRYKGKIRYACIDMSQAYSAWVAENIPKAKVVFGHFHLIKAMTEKMDHVRRREMAKLDYEAKSALEDWCQAARALGIFETCQMANMAETAPRGNPRLLGLRPRKQRLRGGLQHKSPAADEAVLRPTRLQVPQVQGHGSSIAENQGQHLRL